MKKRKSDEGTTVPDQRSFKLLKDTIEGSKFDKSTVIDADYFGKTPMQAAKFLKQIIKSYGKICIFKRSSKND